MHLNEEEFNAEFTEALDAVLAAMAESPEIDPAKFYSMVCVLENLQFFSPVIFGALRNSPK
jgi:hypothetical protein